MAELLAKLVKEQNPQVNVYMNAERARLFEDRMKQSRSPRERVPPQVNYAMELLHWGKFQEAIAQFEAVQKTVESGELQVPPEELKRLRWHLETWSAVAWMRLGELQNCIEGHGPESCLLPFRGGGIHRNPTGSEQALEILSKTLKERPGDTTLIWLINLAAMTLGRHPDAVPEPWRIPPSVFDSEYDIKRFPEIAAHVGLDAFGLAGGVVLDDLDGDEDLDLIVSSWGPSDQIRFYVNNGDGAFLERTVEAGLAGICGGLNLIHADYDNDGDADVLVIRGAWRYEQGRIPDSLLRNNGDGTFSDVTIAAGLLSFHPSQTAGWADYDNDGWLDLFIGNESAAPNTIAQGMYQNPGEYGDHPCELFHNNGDGTFTECAAKMGVAHVSYVKAAVWGDYNNDGRPDLYLSCLGSDNVLYRNDGPAPAPPWENAVNAKGPRPWRFTNVAQEAGVTEPKYAFPTWFFDYDNDGRLDLFVCGYAITHVGQIVDDYLGRPHDAERPRLYHNHGDGTFKNVTREAGIYRILLGMGANYGDLDNDGFLDFYIGTGLPDFRSQVPNRMFRNDAGRRFQDVTSSGGFGHVQKGHGVAFADIDQDGDQDVFEVMGGAYLGDGFSNVLYQNPGHGNRWVGVHLVGVRSNRCAIGARLAILVETPGGLRWIHRLVGSGGSFGASPLRQHVGLGDATAIRELRISWPGAVPGGEADQVLQNPPMDGWLRIREGEKSFTLIPLKPIDFTQKKGSEPEHEHHHSDPG